MTGADLIVTALIVMSVPFAVHATWDLWHLYRHDESRSLLLLGIALASSAVTVAGGWFGLLAVRRLLGLDALDWSPPVTGLLAVLIFWIPWMFELIVDRIGRRADLPDNIGRGPE